MSHEYHEYHRYHKLKKSTKQEAGSKKLEAWMPRAVAYVHAREGRRYGVRAYQQIFLQKNPGPSEQYQKETIAVHQALGTRH